MRVCALDLVRDGVARATIISGSVSPIGEAARQGKPAKGVRVPVETDEQLAVRVLGEWVKKMTDVELPVAEVAPEGGVSIHVGRAAIAAGLNVDDIESPSREGLRIEVEGQRVLIGGQSEGATLKAVCRFLEELGCRYLMDGPLGEVYPISKTLSVGGLRITEKPGLSWRNPKGPSWNARLWKAWNGAGGTVFGHAHSWGGYVPAKEFEQHPEYFALGQDGQRKNNGWLCTSNGELRERFALGVVSAIEKGATNPSLSPTDGRGYCQCATCKSQDDPSSLEPSSGTVSISNRYTDFFDWVGRRVAQTNPGSVLSFYCYADYTQPPTLKRALSPNLCAMIAPIRYCRLHPMGHVGCGSREQQVGMIQGWASVAKRLGYYNYMYNLADGTLPMFKFSACKKEFPYLAERGLTYMTIEVLSNWHIYGPQIYLSLRMAYDPGADAEAVMDDYWVKFYGAAAAPAMKEYWMGIDAAQQALKTHAGSFFGLAQVYTPEFLTRCEGLLARAEALAASDPVFTKRVALHAEGLRSARSYRTISDAMDSGDFAGALVEYERTLVRLKSLIAEGGANPEYGVAYLERFLSKTVRSGAAALAAPNRLISVLPDRMRFSADENDDGEMRGFHRSEFKDEDWMQVATRRVTLDVQGFDKNSVLWYRTRFYVPESHGPLSLFFGEVDGSSEVFVNGRRVDVPAVVDPTKDVKRAVERPVASASPSVPVPVLKAVREGLGKSRTPFEVDVTDVVRAGENVLALRVDHTRMTDLSLGGILRPILLIERPRR